MSRSTRALVGLSLALVSIPVFAAPSANLAEIKANAILAETPTVNAASALIMDAKSGRILWSKDADTQRYPASTTKILTALLLLENCSLDDRVTAPFDIDKVTGSSLHLKPYEQMSVNDLLFGLMMRSANDGCEAVAKHISGSVEGFADLMNERAVALGATHSHFKNPHGLHDEDHYTTARDLAIIAREAMKNEKFREVAAQQKYTVTRSINQEDRYITNRNKLLDLDDTVTGIKTGWTVPAGKCFVGSIERNGVSLITVVLKSEDWVADTTRLNEWAMAHFVEEKLVSRGDPIGFVPVEGGRRGQAAAVAANDVYALVSSSSNVPKAVPSLDEKVKAPVGKGESLGHLEVTLDDGTILTAPILSAEDIEAKPALAATIATPGGAAIGGLFVLSWAMLRRKSRRMTRR